VEEEPLEDGKMNIKRIARHLFTLRGAVKRHFSKASLKAIEEAIGLSEKEHGGEIRFAVESSLPLRAIVGSVTGRERAIQVFSDLRVWDTADNSGVLIYLLLADRDVEIVADRGINKHATQERWEKVCREMEEEFKAGNFKEGVIMGIELITKHLKEFSPRREDDQDELPNKPVIV